MHLTNREIALLEQRYRAALINSITGFKSVSLIGTANSKKQCNLAIFSSIMHLGAYPPLLGFIVRPDSVERHTLSNIQETGVYTINHIHADFFTAAHQTSARYPREINEFEATDLTACYHDDFAVPYVKESPLQIGLQLKEIIKIDLNKTMLIIGEIQHLYFDQCAIADDGFVDLEKLGSITCSGLDCYHRTQKIARLTYAKPGQFPSER